MGNTDIEYFSRRLRQEREAADSATPAASAIHRQLADKYADMLASEDGKQDPTGGS